ncbi:MAG TPA: hypothetical protein VJK07_03015 [Candidatus Nanoarchaeia archaeon]|nr:hypothetical protein [Candidatus Nanoarchaeia archaeon]
MNRKIKIEAIVNRLMQGYTDKEMDEIGVDLWRIKETLERGYDCSKSKRAKNVVERCLFRKNKEIRVVATLVEFNEGEFWRIIHVGKTGGH